MTHKSYSSGFGSVPNSTPKDNDPMVRIADALEEILRLVKADQERSKKYMEESKDPFIKTMEEGENE
jgi:hypothetical protein